MFDTAPDASCTVRVQARSNNADVTVDSSDSPLTKTLSFTSSTWNTAQTVTVSGLHDGDGANDATVIRHRIPAAGACYTSGHYTQSEGTNTSPLAIAPVSVLVDDDESTDTVTASITSTPANGTHYVAGETITTRLSGLAPLGSGAVHTNRMRLTVDGVERRAGSTSSFRTRMTEISFAYTVTAAGFDADGIAIPANSIVGGTWTERQDRSQSGPINFASRPPVFTTCQTPASHPSRNIRRTTRATSAVAVGDMVWSSTTRSAPFSRATRIMVSTKLPPLPLEPA